MPASDVLLDGVRKVESSNGKYTKSSAGALGDYQFMPDTWKQWSKKAGVGDKSPHDDEAARKTARVYLNYLLEKFNNDPELALTAYHTGEGTISKLLRETGGNSLEDIKSKLGPRGQEYASKVLREVGKLSALV